MTETTYRDELEQHVRRKLRSRYGVEFRVEQLRLSTGGFHKFDAVASDHSVVAAIRTHRGGRGRAAQLTECVVDLYYLSLVEAPRRLLVLTSPEFYALFAKTMRGKVAPGITVAQLPLPAAVDTGRRLEGWR